MARPLNAKLVENARPDPGKRLEIPDGGLVGLYLQVQPSGAKSWAVRYRHAGRPVKLTLGPYPRLGLGTARESAREALRIVSEGGDPMADRITLARLKRLPRPASDHHFEAVLERFIGAQERKGRRTTGEMRRILEADALPRWKGRPIAEITGADVHEAVEAIVQRGAPVAAARFRAWLSKLFSYAIKVHLRPDNPAKATENPVEPKSIQRDRRLDDRELSAVWHAAGSLGYPFGLAVRMLILTGQRRSEVLEARWSEFDLGGRTWTIPASRAKNGREHLVPLSEAAIEIVRELPRMVCEDGEDCPFLFSTNGKAPVSGVSKAKVRLDKLVEAANGGTPIAAWRLHDLRRTCASGLARLRVPQEVVERILNHTTGVLGGLATVYNLHSYERERRSALRKWAAHVQRIAGASAEVVPLRVGKQ